MRNHILHESIAYWLIIAFQFVSARLSHVSYGRLEIDGGRVEKTITIF